MAEMRGFPTVCATVASEIGAPKRRGDRRRDSRLLELPAARTRRYSNGSRSGGEPARHDVRVVECPRTVRERRIEHIKNELRLDLGVVHFRIGAMQADHAPCETVSAKRLDIRLQGLAGAVVDAPVAWADIALDLGFERLATDVRPSRDGVGDQVDETGEALFCGLIVAVGKLPCLHMLFSTSAPHLLRGSQNRYDGTKRRRAQGEDTLGGFICSLKQ